MFQAVFGQHGQQHLAVAELKHSSVPIIPSHAPPFVFAQPTARHTSMWSSTPQILANCNNMQQLISNCLLSLVCHTESYCIYYILASPAMDCNLRVLMSSLYLAWHTPNTKGIQGVQHLLNNPSNLICPALSKLKLRSASASSRSRSSIFWRRFWRELMASPWCPKGTRYLKTSKA